MEALRVSHKSLSPSSVQAKHPLLKALLVQVLSFVVCFAFAVIAKKFYGYVFIPFTFLLLLLFHSFLSLLISLLLKFEWWWNVIAFIFPIFIFLGLYLQISSALSLVIFLFLFFVFGTTLTTRVPYFPSHSSLSERLLEFFSDKEKLRLLDAGSGLGGLIIDLSKARPDWKLTGVEISSFPWLFSFLRSKILRRQNVKFQLGSYEYLNFEKFDVVFAYLSPVVMSEIWKKVQYEMVPGSIFMSYEFPIDGEPPSFEIQVSEKGEILYVWQM